MRELERAAGTTDVLCSFINSQSGVVLGSILGVRRQTVGIFELHNITSTFSLMTSEAALDEGFMIKTAKG